MSRLSWPAIVKRAEQIVNEYDTPVTLRQLFYRLVAALILRSAHAPPKPAAPAPSPT